MKTNLPKQGEQVVRQGQPIVIVEPATQEAYVLVPHTEVLADETRSISPGIRRSQEAYWRDLPELLQQKSQRQRWVAYHGDQRIGFGRTSAELYHKCMEQHGLMKGEFYVDRVEPRPQPPWEAEHLEASFSFAHALAQLR